MGRMTINGVIKQLQDMLLLYGNKTILTISDGENEYDIKSIMGKPCAKYFEPKDKVAEVTITIEPRGEKYGMGEKLPHETEFVNDALQIVPWKDCECVEFRYQNEYGKKTFRIISLGMLFLNGNKREDVNKFVFDMIDTMRRELKDE